VNINDDTEFRNVINLLKQLQQVKAPANFEADLMRRINSGEVVEKTFWQSILIPSRLIPSAALALTAILLIFVLNNSGVTHENPFSVIPRERHDNSTAITIEKFAPAPKSRINDNPLSTGNDEGMQKDKAIQNNRTEKAAPKQQTVKPQLKGNIAQNNPANDRYINLTFASGRIKDYPVNKAGLNFRHIKISNEQRSEINQLKKRLEMMFHSNMQ